MELRPIVEKLLEELQNLQKDAILAKKIGQVILTLGPQSVKVYQIGKQVVMYLISQIKPEPPKPAPVPKPELGRDDLETVTSLKALVSKDHVAILIDINRRMLVNVARFLDAQGIDADMLIVTNDPEYSSNVQFLPVDSPETWVELVQEFNQAMNAIKLAVGSAHIHIFLSTPLPLAFGLGSVWGTVDKAMVYHWQENTYHPVMPISRTLRQ